MSLYIGYQQCWLPGIVKAASRSDLDFRGWISTGDWSFDQGLTKKRLGMEVYDKGLLTEASLNEFLTLASAAFESAASLNGNPHEGKSCAWQVIAYYYSSYFAANAIMRLCGFYCANFDSKLCTEINEKAALFGEGGGSDSKKLSPGVFYCQVDFSGTAKVVAKALSGVKGGVHIQFWNGFSRFLDALETMVNTSPLLTDDKTKCVSDIRVLRAALSFGGNGSGAWLSEVRNAVNYRFDYGLWYPYIGSDLDVHMLRNALRDVLRGNADLPSGLQRLPDPLRLAPVCGYLLRLVEQALKVVGKSSKGKRKVFVDGGLMQFADQLVA